MVQIPHCHKKAVSIEPLEPVDIFSGCGELRMSSITGHAKTVFLRLAFRMDHDQYGVPAIHEFFSVAFMLLEAEQLPDKSTKGLFNVELEWSSLGDLQKRMVYTRRRYLSIDIFSQYSYQFSIELEWESSLGQLPCLYMRKILVANQHDDMELKFGTSWIGDKEPEVCFRKTSSCYRYQKGSQITWNIAQARCAEQNANLVSVNSPEEWHSLLWWAYNLHGAIGRLRPFISDIDVFKGRLLFIGQRRVDVRTYVSVLGGF